MKFVENLLLFRTWLPMTLSQCYEPVRHRRRERRGGAQATDHAGQVETPVEAVGEFGEVARQVLGPNRPAIRPVQGILDVAQHRVDPHERLAPLSALRAARNQRFMGTAGLPHGGEAGQSVGAHVSIGRQVPASPTADLAAAETPHPIHTHRQRLAFCRVGGHRRYERRLAARAASDLVTAPPAAPVGVIHLDDPGKLPALLALEHRLHELVFHEPGTVVADTQLPRQFQGRDAVLRLREQIDRQQPFGQWQLRAGKQRSGRDRGLPAAAVALVEPAAEHAVPCVPALGADEALRPAPGEQRRLALHLGSVMFKKFAQTHALLKLHLVPRHRLSPCEIKQCQFATPTGSLAEPYA